MILPYMPAQINCPEPRVGKDLSRAQWERMLRLLGGARQSQEGSRSPTSHTCTEPDIKELLFWVQVLP